MKKKPALSAAKNSPPRLIKQVLSNPPRPGLRVYSTALWDSSGLARPSPPYVGAGWSMALRRYEQSGGEGLEQLELLRKHVGFFPPSDSDYNRCETSSWRSAPELVIFARDREQAQRAANLLMAAIILYDGQCLFINQVIAVPENESERALYSRDDLFRETGMAYMSSVATSAALAARLSRRTTLQYAALKFWASIRTCSLPFIDTHPSHGRRFGVEDEKANHVLFAQAIVSAYSVLEEIGFELRASLANPSTIGGKWNPSVRADLEQRLCDGGINLSDDEVWLARGPKTRLEKKRALPSGTRAVWSGGYVRDQHIAVVDAIARASWLRSKVGAHRFSELVPSLTAIDVANVQFLARRLLLEHVGFLPGTEAHSSRCIGGRRPGRATNSKQPTDQVKH